MNSLRRPWAVVAAILLGGPVDAAPMQVYNSLNFINPGETGYGYLGVTSLDKSAIYGDSLRLTATGKLTSFTWAAYNGPGSTDDLTSASQTISFYRQSNASLIGSFNATITDLGKGSYKTFTADLTSANIVLDTPDILVTQQIPFWPPASPTYRLGIVVSASSNTPVIGTTGTGYYRSAFGSQGAFFTDVSAPNYSGSSGNFVARGPGSRKIVGFTPGNVLVPAPAAPPLLQAGPKSPMVGKHRGKGSL